MSASNDSDRSTERKTIGIGIIGTGIRGALTLGSRIVDTAHDTDFRVVALCDHNALRLQEAHDRLQRQYAAKDLSVDIRLTDDHTALIADPDVDLIMITTPQNYHRDPALAALQSGKKVYLDKPIAHTMEDARAIVSAEALTGNPMILGFTRRYEMPWRKAYELLQAGVIGDLHMVQIRAIIPYNVYFHRWHRQREWSGGALNDKSSHHMDVFNWFAGGTPRRLSAFGGRRVFLPRADAPARCSECDLDCPYRVAASRDPDALSEGAALANDSYAQETEVFGRLDNCVFLPGADIKDHANVQIQYDNGVIASLFLSFFGPKATDQETLELVGTSGRIILTRHTGTLDVVSDYGAAHEIVECQDQESASTHFGADLKLIRELRSFYDGAAPTVSATDGFQATRMIMATHDSIDNDGETIDMSTYA